MVIAGESHVFSDSAERRVIAPEELADKPLEPYPSD
jgi:hypothetical protein